MDRAGVGVPSLLSFTLIFTICLSFSNADTVIDTSPSADLTLRRSDQPFYVNSSIIVPPGITLTVEPGVTVTFDPGVTLSVRGRLVAKGQPGQRIRFTAADTPNIPAQRDSPPIWFDGARLAGDFTSSHVGRLELLLGGSYGTVCQNGWNSHWYYSYYNTRVAARMLGYKYCTRVNNRGGGTGNILLSNVRCNGHEDSLWDCRHDGVRVHNCFHSQDVWLQCSGYSGYRGDANETAKYWSGIQLVTNSSEPGVSDLQYVDVEFAGLPNIETHSNDTAAISVSGTPPVLENLNITNVIGNGVLLRDIAGHALINDSYIEASLGNGVSFRSFGGDLAMNNVQISNVNKAGVYYNRTLPLPSYKMCLTPETTVPDGQPLIVSFDSTDLHLGLETSCSQVFWSRSSAQILAVRILYIRTSWRGNVNILDIYDGNSTNHERLERVHMYGDEVTMPSPLYTTGGSVLLSFSRLNINFWERYQGMFSIQSVAAHSDQVGLSVHSVDIRKAANGILIESQLHHLLISEARVAHSSETGLYVGKGSGTIVLQDSVFMDNSIHMYFEHIQRNVTVDKNEFNDSSNYALSVGSASVWILSNNVRFVFQNNTLLDSSFGIWMPHARECALTDIIVFGNVFKNQSTTAIRLGTSYRCNTHRLRNVQVMENVVYESNGTAAFLIETGVSTEILNNTLFDNDVSQCVLCVSASSLFMTGNTFRDNNVRNIYKRHQVGASLIVKNFVTVFTFTSNIFENPSVEYQLATWHENSVLRKLDVSRNYWGTSDPFAVYSGILDNTKLYTLRTEFLYTPFYITSDLSSLSSDVDPTPPPYTLGGRIKTDLTLNDTDRPYTVTRDLNVTANATLTIEPGVALEFEDSVGMYVEGRLNVSGTASKRCIFTAKGKSAITKNMTCPAADSGLFVLYREPYRYDINTFYGRLYGKENGRTLPVCYDSSIRGPMLNAWLAEECKRLGYTFFGRIDTITDTAKMGLQLHCARNESNFEDNCSTGMQRYKCASFFRVVCAKHSRDSTWAGIRLGMTARSSSIKHAVLQFAGYLDSGSSSKGPSLQVDFNRHNISNVAILTSGGGIRQLYVDGTERSMSNMVMADIDNNAFETYTLSAFLRDSSMKDISSHAVLLQSSLSWTTTTYFTPYKHDCGTSHLANEGDMLPFVSYLHGPCGTFTTRPGLKLRVFIIYSNYLDYQLLLTDTVKNWTVGLNSTDSVFTTSTNTVQFLKAWRKRCSGCSVYIYAVVMAVEDHLPPYKPSLKLENILISGSYTVVYGQHQGSTNGIRTDGRHLDYPYVGQVGVDIKDSVIVGNYRFMDVRLYSVSHVPLVNELLPSFAITVKNTTLDSNDYGIYIYNYRGSREQLTIDGCKISGTRGTLLQYFVRDDNPKDVDIRFPNNIITDNKGNILDISGGTLNMTVSRNEIMGNGYSSGSMIRYSGYEKVIHFVNNDISGNSYKNIIDTNMEKTKYGLSNSPSIVLTGNIMIYNTYSSGANRRQPARPPSSATLTISGYIDHLVQNNTLQNPGLQAEVYVMTRSTKWKDGFDARFNFWGCDNTTCVRGRVYDAHNDMYLPEVRLLPFVSRSNEMVYTPDVTEGHPQGNVLGGWLNQSIRLAAKDSPYYLKEDWTILHNVEVVIEPGVWVKPSRDKGVLVLGKLIADGDKEKKIVFGCKYPYSGCNQWQGIVFASDNSTSEIIHVDFYSAGYKSGYHGSTIQTVKSSIVVMKSRIFGSAFNGIELVMPKGENIIKNNDFIDNGGVGVNVISVQTRSQALDTSVQYESVGWPGVLYGLDNMCDTNTKTLRIETDSILYFSNRPIFYRYNCTKTILSTREITALQILQFSMRFNYLLEIFEGISPLTAKRIIHVDQNDHYIPYDIPINSSSVTVRLVNGYRDWKYYGTESIVFGVKVGKDLSILKETRTRREIEGNAFSNNGLGGVNITTVGEDDVDFAITKNTFRSNGQSSYFRAEYWKAAIRLNIAGSCSVTIANNYLDGNHGGILARIHSQSININIWSNQIVRTTQQESILVVAVEDGPHTHQCSIDGNVIQHGQGDRYSDVLHLEGVSGTVTNNYIYNNTGLHVMWWTTQPKRNTMEVTTDNVIYYNIARDANNMAAVVAGVSSSFLHGNYFHNPSFKFEITSEGASTAVNASFNWWGLTGHAQIKQRIRDNSTGFSLPHVIIQPILDSKADFLNGPKVSPAYFPRQIPEVINGTFLPDTRDCSRFYEFTARGTIPRVCPRGLVWNPEVKACDVHGCLPVKQFGLCPLGWLQNDSICYLYVGGVQTFSDAVGSCEKEYSMPFSPQGEEESDFVASVLKSRAIGQQSYGLWTGNQDWKSGKCSLFNITAVDGSGGTYLEECSHFAPFICKRTAGSKCLNGCSYNGRCGYDKRCHCNRGWEGKDCSVYHCRDRNKCGKYGTCVGPNQCMCQPGWQGRACSVSYCPVYRSCRSCTEQPGCGWCDHKQRCLPGYESQPLREQCGTWFYHDCFSVDTHMGCSKEIEYIGCEYRQCNSTIRYASDELCHRCRDVEACFSDDMSYGCRYWDMGKCPHGLVRPDYHHGNRALDTTLHPHVVAINPSKAELYVCPLPSKPGQTIIVSRDRIRYPRHRNFSIVSRQAGGIMHNVYSTKETGTYKYFSTSTAKLEDIIQYANINQTVPVHYLMDDGTLDHIPEVQVLQNALVQQGKVVNGSTVRAIEAPQRVYKCLGHWYDVSQRPIASQYIILLKNAVVGVQVGDVMVGTVSHGFLEDVEDIVEEAGAKLYHGQLKTCGNAMSLASIKTPPGDISKTMYCHGGEHNDKSLHIAQPVTEQAETTGKGDVIPGRASGSFLGRVISLFEKGDYILIECIPVHDISDSGIYTNAPYTAFHPGKRLITTLSTGSVFTTVKRKAKLQAPSKYKHQVELEMTIGVAARLELHLQSTLPKARKMGVRLDTTFEYTLNGSYEALSGSNDIRIYRSVLGRTPLGVHCLDLSSVLCLPVNINIAEIKYGFIAETQGMGVLWRHSQGSIMEKLGGTWRNGAEIVHFPRDVVTNVSNTVQINDGIENVNIKVDIETKFKVTIPSISAIITSSLYRPRHILDFLREILDTEAIPGNTVVFGYEPTVVITDILSIDTCSKACFGRGGDHLLVHRAGTGDSKGVLVLRFGTSWKISSGREEGRLPGVTAHCKAATTSTMCPADPNSCSCADGSNSTMFKSVCQCELCPDGIFKRAVTSDISQPTCPCFCVDNKAREMNSDGSCPCDCQCPNGNNGFIKQDGSCHCPCQCKNCQFALQKYDGTCDCPNDICPVCDSAYEPVWEDCHCVCREKTQCGLYPACVRGRRGEQCDQPDCEPCSLQTDSRLLECFGNGVCTPDSHFCRSSCVCTRFWTGRCCNVRVGRTMGGDPHLTTLDGLEYDYHGIGEFWYCISPANNFGVQVRFFGYKLASLVGAVAVKVGQSVVTITTPDQATAMSLPIIRIDGSQQSPELNNTRLELSNGTAIVDIVDVRNISAGAVMMITFQYSSGASITVGVHFSSTMGRLFLNVDFTPTARFRGDTSGLCGLMDDNEDNDLTMPNGTLAGDAVQFADSWRVNASSLSSGGWSWNRSNFHVDDVMDPSYTDPSLYSPSYSTANVSQSELEVAEIACKAKGLEGVLLQQCVFDIAVTKDEAFANLERYQTGCPGHCNGKGRCVKGSCECNDKWSGPDCSIGFCGACANGVCDSGFCVCSVGWEGSTCEEKAVCLDVNNCTDEEHGVCEKTNTCRCAAGFIGVDCSIDATCSNVSDCSGHGVCVDFDVCKCDSGWAGPNCTVFSCESLAACSGHGQCVGYDLCRCDSGWHGNGCALPDCSSNNDCSLHGVCTSPGICSCFDGYHGDNCSEVINCSMLNDCNGHGICVAIEGNENHTMCRCYDGYSGATCATVSCSFMNNCSGNGVCLEPNLCDCELGFSGSDCSNFSCEAIGYCSDNGQCVSFDTCQCFIGWLGARCDEPVCADVSNCSGHGTCVSANQCECFDEYDGDDCSVHIGPNIHSPSFAHEWYNTSILENTVEGSAIIFQNNITNVSAIDADAGRNGELSYSMYGSNGAGFFSVDNQGQILIITTFDFENLAQKEFIMTVVATDKGEPPKSTAAKVSITVQDVNDNAPEFQLLVFPDILLDASGALGRIIGTFVAVDVDSGSNGRVHYSFTGDSNPNNTFAVDQDTGQLTVMRYPAQSRYELFIVAEDGGEPPGSAILPVVITIYGHVAEKPGGASISTSISSLPGYSETDQETGKYDWTTSTNMDGIYNLSAAFYGSTETLSEEHVGMTTTKAAVTTPANGTVGQAPFKAWYQTMGFQAGVGVVGALLVLGLLVFMIQRCLLLQKRKVRVNAVKYVRETQECTPSVSSLRSHREVQGLCKKHTLPPNAKPDGNTPYLAQIPGYDSAVKDHTADVNICSPPPVQHQFSFSFRPSQPRQVLPPLKDRNIQPIGQEFELPEKK